MRAPRLALARLALLCLGLGACQVQPPVPPSAAIARPLNETWQAVILAPDADRIARLAVAWETGLAEARAAGFRAQIAAAGTTLDPNASLARVAPPPGSYRCRVIRLGAGPGRRAFTLYPAYFCHIGVEGALLSLAKQTGSERFGGYLFAESDSRLVFLGAANSGDGPAPAYGADTSGDNVGVIERIGPMRYRLVLPWPRSGAKLDVIELAPVVPPLD